MEIRLSTHLNRSFFPIILLITLLFSSCFFDPDPDANGGVVITFDDRHVAEWVWADSVLSEYDWKATFCLSGLQALTSSQFGDLRGLKAAGHEIAGHSVSHRNAVDYVAANGMDAYLNDEILPMIDIMKQENLKPVTFAYPFGDRSDEIDDTLFTYFKVLRSTTYTWSEPSVQTCYYEHDPLVYGLGMDGSPTENRITYFLSLLDYAKANKKILIVYSHKPVPEWTGALQTDIRTLQAICNYVSVNNMRFYTLSELQDKSASKILHVLRPQ
jgi:peptidoglycan/xylan/chitin deacetylase (PgdA/CDA1 family)